jgi:hypothetical protein
MSWVGDKVQSGIDKITGKDAAEDAAAAQRAATDASIGFQEESLKQTREDLQPFRDAGQGAISDLQAAINGMPTSSGIDTSAINNFVNDGGRANLDADLQAFMDPQAQADYLANDPLYKAIADDTNRRLNAQAAAAGKLHSGGTAKALQDNMMLLGRERVNDRMNQLTTGFNAGSTNRSNALSELTTKFNLDFNKANLDSNLDSQKTNSLFNLVTQGQNAAARQATATQNTGNALSNLTVAQGNADAAAQVAPHNNLMTLAQGGAMAYFMSDRRTKENIKRVGTTDGGLPVYTFNYIGDMTTQMGVMAQDVEKVDPKAVREFGGIKHVDYRRVA